MRKIIIVLVSVCVLAVFAGAAEKTGGYRRAQTSRVSARPDSRDTMMDRRLDDRKLSSQRITDAQYKAGLPGVLRRERRQQDQQIGDEERRRPTPEKDSYRKRQKERLQRFYLLHKEK